MSEKSDGKLDTGSAGPPAQLHQEQRRRALDQRRGNREGKFEGKCEAIKNSTYDVVAGKDTFLKTTREIAEYVS
jgi:hypothetical protein